MAYITAANTPDTLTGTREADTIIGSSGGDTIQMVFNSGVVFPNLVIDIVDGGAGNDTISGGSFRDIVHGGDGDDLLRASDGPLLFGDAGNDHLISGEYESMDYLDGGAGNDVLESGGPSTSLFYQSAAGGIRVDLDERGPQTIGGGEGVDTIPRFIYYAVGSQYDDVILGSRVGGAILGGPGNDRLEVRIKTTFYGEAGDDTLVGSSATDTIDFAQGRSTYEPDFARLPAATGGVVIDLHLTGPQVGGGGFGRDTLISIENVSGTFFSDSITGDEGANIIYGIGSRGLANALSGGDSLFGGGGDDLLVATGGAGSYLRGGEGNDDLRGGGDMLGNQGNDTLYGSGGRDWVVGGQDQDVLFGNDGDDIVYGNRGRDTLDAGAGNDTVRGGQDDDVVSGGAGNDFVAGDLGNDTLTGGTGADSFYTSAAAGIDRVIDFSRAEGDRVQVELGDSWTVAQEGADTVVHVGAASLVLAGVSMAGLSGDWIFSAS
jgi:Ca2+-binding RTX toxin-like protein